jgi:hypothetical protein
MMEEGGRGGRAGSVVVVLDNYGATANSRQKSLRKSFLRVFNDIYGTTRRLTFLPITSSSISCPALPIMGGEVINDMCVGVGGGGGKAV